MLTNSNSDNDVPTCGDIGLPANCVNLDLVYSQLFAGVVSVVLRVLQSQVMNAMGALDLHVIATKSTIVNEHGVDSTKLCTSNGFNF